MSLFLDGSPEPTNLFAVWTPRMTHIRTDKKNVWYLPRQKKFPFAPNTLGEYRAPPPPPPLKKPPPVKATPPTTAELMGTAEELRREAAALESSGVRSAPPLSIQLGMLLLSKDGMITKLMKDWDQKGKGEFIKAEFRLNLRNTGLNANSAEADALFDSWDDVCDSMTRPLPCVVVLSSLFNACNTLALLSFSLPRISL